MKVESVWRGLLVVGIVGGVAVFAGAVLEQSLAVVSAAVAVAAVVALLSVTPGDEDGGGPMPAVWRRLLTVYLFSLAVAATSLLVALYSVSFREAVSVEASPQKPPSDSAQPMITSLSPSEIVAGSGPVTLSVAGYNFTSDAKLRLNLTERKPEASAFINENLMLVSLVSAELAQPGLISVVVAKGDRSSNPVFFKVSSAAELRGELRFLFQSWFITENTRLLLIVLAAGLLGGFIHAGQSLADYAGNRKLVTSWYLFYVSRPFLGSALALVFYATIRGGFLAGSPADVKSVNPFGVAAVAALVGMFADKAAQKLGDVFEVLFKTDDRRSDKLAKPAISKIEPPVVRTGTTPPPQLRIVGTNLLQAVSIRVNGEVRQPQSSSDQLIVLALTPTDVQGSGVLKVSVADSTGNSVDATVRVTDLRVATTDPLPSASTTSAYQHKLQGAGGTPPHTFSVKNLPAGLSSDSDGLITGTAKAAVAAADVAITVRDADKTEVTESRKLTVT